MKSRTRTILFFTFSALFFAVMPLVIMYSQGYRADFERRTFVKTGGLFLEPRPAPVKVYIDQRLRKESNFLFQNIYIGNLFPKLYHIEIKKDEYFSWEKNIEVFPKLVTEAKNIFLFPRDLKLQPLIRDIADFYPSPDGRQIAVSKIGSPAKANMYSLEDAVEHPFYQQNTVSSTPQRVSQIIWSDDSSMTAIVLINESSSFLVALDTKTRAPQIVKVDRARILSPMWNPLNSDEIIFIAADLKYNLLVKYSTKTKKIPQILAYDALSYTISDGKVHYVSSVTQAVHAIDLRTGEFMQMSFFSDRIEQGKKVYSSDKKKFLMASEKEIWVQWSESVHIQPFRDAGDRTRIVRTNTPILDAIWFTKNNEYIIFSDSGGIHAIELDTRDNQNTYTLTSMPAQKLHYDETRNTLYFLASSILYVAELK